MNLVNAIQPNSYAVRKASAITTLVFHHSAGSATSGRAAVEGIRDWHKSHNGWPDIGYHFLIGSDGVIYQTNDLTRISYHVAYHNDYTIGVCFLGYYENSKPSEPALAAARELLAFLEATLARTLAVKGHAETNPSSTEFCPSRLWHQWKEEIEMSAIDDLRAEIAHLNGVNTELARQLAYKDQLLQEANSALGALTHDVIAPAIERLKDVMAKLEEGRRSG